jgi:hypothetical protein
MKHSLITLFSGLIIFASSQNGGSGIYKFLDLPVPARTAALGGNTIALQDDDMTLSFQNPALLSKNTNNQACFAFIDYFADIKYGYTAYARSFEKIGNFSAGMQFVNYGSFQAADEFGTIEGNFKASDYSLNLAYSRQKDSTFSYGVTIKTIYSKYERYYSVGSALDLGATYHNHKHNFDISVVGRNFGMQWRSYSGNGKEKLEFTSQIGISKKIPKAPFRLIFTYQYLEKWDLTSTDPENPPATVDPFTGEAIKEKKFQKFMGKLGRHTLFGTEILITKNFNLRLGYNYMRQADLKLPDRKSFGGLTFGLGLKIYKFHISYAHANYHVAAGSNHFTITTNLSSFKKAEKKPVDEPQP